MVFLIMEHCCQFDTMRFKNNWIDYRSHLERISQVAIGAKNTSLVKVSIAANSIAIHFRKHSRPINHSTFMALSTWLQEKLSIESWPYCDLRHVPWLLSAQFSLHKSIRYYGRLSFPTIIACHSNKQTVDYKLFMFYEIVWLLASILFQNSTDAHRCGQRMRLHRNRFSFSRPIVLIIRFF